ncbi:hypothetical protein BD410DRAFT_88569 [Rickenella mellea]|uniref:Uncharacterized protein n=1 Tax=Rickenella mellea TaxID=50990 RepID=A0A4Y7QC75_9AGAM|nr:hypothetical protein BD410DRAFT_88569 [Rickenella mellea]
MDGVPSTQHCEICNANILLYMWERHIDDRHIFGAKDSDSSRARADWRNQNVTKMRWLSRTNCNTWTIILTDASVTSRAIGVACVSDTHFDVDDFVKGQLPVGSPA